MTALQPTQTPALLQALDLDFHPGGIAVLGPLNFSVRPGLTWVCGGDGRGKTTLLRLMAGRLQPTAGVVRDAAISVFDQTCIDPALDDVVAQAWLESQQVRYPHWDPAVQARLAEAWGLPVHLPKPFYMLSAGSRRKVGLLAAAACGAELTLLDTPFAALDAPSGRVLTQLLLEACSSPTRAWVVADYQCPAAFEGRSGAQVIDLGE